MSQDVNDPAECGLVTLEFFKTSLDGSIELVQSSFHLDVLFRLSEWCLDAIHQLVMIGFVPLDPLRRNVLGEFPDFLERLEVLTPQLGLQRVSECVLPIKKDQLIS